MSQIKRSVTETTYRYELRRGISSGVIETAIATFLLLIVVRHFEAGPIVKAIVAAGGSLGLLLTPFMVSIVGRLRTHTSRAASKLAFLGAGCFLMAALIPVLPVFTFFSVAGMASVMAMVPLLTQMYQENYPEGERGSRYSKTVMVRTVAAAIFSCAAGWLLSGRMERFPLVLLGFAAAAAFSGRCLARCPTTPLTREGGTHPFRAVRYVREDRLFRVTLIAWMLMGLGNLMMLPLRVEYLANPKYGLVFSAGAIALLTSVIPNISRFITIALWGRIFDRMNFFVMRATLNLGFALSILMFFKGNSLLWLVLAAVTFGLANAGGDVAWSLWVTKVAPPSRVADYMSVHTFLTGTRMALSPFLAFGFVQILPITLLSWISAGLILTASAMLVPEFKRGIPKRMRPVPLVKEGLD